MNNESLTSRIGRFEIQRELGRGAFGIVYLAIDPQLERAVALKVPHFGTEENSKKVARFLREAKAAACLHHPNIVAVHDAGQHGSRYYIASAFVEGATLRDLLRKNGMPSATAAAKLISKLANAIGYANEQGVVHRDVKPENVLVERDGTPYLVDFGLARRDSEDVLQTQEGTVLGTPAYMSPEQASGKGGTVDGKTDQWSLGVMLYEMLSGVRPFEGNSMQMMYAIQHGSPLELRKRNSRIPRDLETICHRCLTKDPKDRFSDCYELSRDLERWLTDESIASRRQSLLERFQRWNRRNPLVANLSVALFASVSLLSAVATIQWLRAESNAASARVSATKLQVSLDEVVEQRQLLSDQKDSLQQSSEKLERTNRDLASTNLNLESAKVEIQQSLSELQDKQRLIELTSAEKNEAIVVSDEERKKRISEQSKNQKLRYFGDIQTARLAIAAGDSEQAKQILASSNAELHSIEWDTLSKNAARYDSDYTPFDVSLMQNSVTGRFMRSVHFPDLAVEPDQISQITTCPRIWDVDANARRWLHRTSTVDVLESHIPLGYTADRRYNTNPVLEGVFTAPTIEAYSINGSVEIFSELATHAWMSPNGQFVAAIQPRVERRDIDENSFELIIVVEGVLFDLQNKEYFRRKLDAGMVSGRILFRNSGIKISATILVPLQWHHFDGVFSRDSSRFTLLSGSDSTLRQWLISEQSATPETSRALSNGKLALPFSAMRTEDDRLVVSIKDRLLTLEEASLKVIEEIATAWPFAPNVGVYFSRNGKSLGLVLYSPATDKSLGTEKSLETLDLYLFSRQSNSWKLCRASPRMIASSNAFGNVVESPATRLAAAERGVFTMEWEKPSLVTDRTEQWVSLQMSNRAQFLFNKNVKPLLDKGELVWQGATDKRPFSLKLFSDVSSIALGFPDRVSVLKRKPTEKVWQVDAVQALVGGNLRNVLPHPKKNVLFVAQDDRLCIFDPVRKKLVAQLASSAANSVLLQTSGRVLFADDQGQVQIVSELDGTLLKKFRVQRNGKSALAIDPEGRYLAAAGEDRRITLWDLSKEKLLGNVLTDVPIQRLRLNPKSKLLSAVGFDNSVGVYEWPTLQRKISLSSSEETVLWCDTTIDGKRLLLASRRGLRVIDLEYGVGVLDIIQFSSPSLCLDLNDLQSTVFSYGEDDRLARYPF